MQRPCQVPACFLDFLDLLAMSGIDAPKELGVSEPTDGIQHFGVARFESETCSDERMLQERLNLSVRDSAVEYLEQECDTRCKR